MTGTKLSVTCAWCGKPMGEKDGQGQTGESHGMCPECYIKEQLKAGKQRITYGGFVATLRTARRHHLCMECYSLIPYSKKYYAIVKGGGGLGWLKHPDRVHTGCLVGYLLKWGEE